MLFNSFEFLVFLPIVFFLYWFVFKKLKWQNALVVVASYVFYGWWDWRFLILIAFTTLCSYFSGLPYVTLLEKGRARLGHGFSSFDNPRVAAVLAQADFSHLCHRL